MNISVSRTALLMIDFQRDFCAPGGYADRYGGVAWANELAKRGYVVLVHDAFLLTL